MKKHITFVGLDVHKNSINVSLAGIGKNGVLKYQFIYTSGAPAVYSTTFQALNPHENPFLFHAVGTLIFNLRAASIIFLSFVRIHALFLRARIK